MIKGLTIPLCIVAVSVLAQRASDPALVTKAQRFVEPERFTGHVYTVKDRVHTPTIIGRVT
jgi:hypothetical protein